MSGRRTHYIVVCKTKDCTAPSCPCCKSCQDLGFNFVVYQEHSGYHYQAPISVTLQCATNRLRGLGVNSFNLVPCRKRVSKKEISLVSQGLKRPASSSEQNSEEEILTKKIKTTLPKGVEVQASPELDIKWRKRISKLEEDQEKTNLQLAYHNKQILGLIHNQQLLTIQLEAKNESFTKALENLSKSNTDSFQKMTIQLSRDFKDGLQETFSDMLSKQAIKNQEFLQSIAPKKPTQVRKANPAPSSTGQSRPQFINHPEPTGHREFPFLQTLGKY